MNLTAATSLALASVTAYAVAAAQQHRVAATAHGIRSLLTSGTWWASTAANTTGALLHVAALKYGPLTLVQCLGALTVVAAVPLAAHTAGRRVSGTEWHGIALTLTGFAALLPLTTTGGGTGVLDTPATLAVALTATLLIPLALSVRSASPRALALAAVSGIVSGAGSALTQTVLNTEQLPSWRTGLVALPAIALAVAGLFLSQCAYAGGLGAPLATLTLANPLTAAAIGLAFLGEGIRGGLPGTTLALAGAALAVRGITLLAGGTHHTAASAHSPQPTIATTAQLPQPAVTTA